MTNRQSTRRLAGDDGLSLIEVLVAMGLFGVLGALLLGLAVSTSQVTEDTRHLVDVTEQSRLAMERMSRELRQAEAITSTELPTSENDTTSITFWTDFNGNNTRDLNAADPEVMTYRWDPVSKQLTLTANDFGGDSVTRPVLAVNVSNFVLELRSSEWEFGQNTAGVTTWAEVDASGAPVGNGDGAPNGEELEHIDLVSVLMTVSTQGRSQTYSTQIDLRNQWEGTQ